MPRSRLHFTARRPSLVVRCQKHDRESHVRIVLKLFDHRATAARLLVQNGWFEAGLRDEPGEFGPRFAVVGNVANWVEDCYVDSYSGAPTDGSPNTLGVRNGRLGAK
jgi:hypothetical protein